MNELLSWPVVGAAALLGAAALTLWLRRRKRLQQQRLRQEGWRLIHALKAYSAWLEALRAEPFLAAEPQETASAQALRSVRAIAQVAFPQLMQAVLRLLAGDSRLLAHLWQQGMDRPGEPAAQRAVQRNPYYRQLHDEQQDLIEEIIARCQVLIGHRDGEWRGTEMDSEFAASFSVNTSSLR